jgi:hypothetical protein
MIFRHEDCTVCAVYTDTVQLGGILGIQSVHPKNAFIRGDLHSFSLSIPGGMLFS